MEDEGLLDLHDNVIVKETQDTPNTFSNNLIQKLGICRNLSSGTEAVSSNNPNYNHLNVCICIHLGINKLSLKGMKTINDL